SGTKESKRTFMPAVGRNITKLTSLPKYLLPSEGKLFPEQHCKYSSLQHRSSNIPPVSHLAVVSNEIASCSATSPPIVHSSTRFRSLAWSNGVIQDLLHLRLPREIPPPWA
ncbi:hypothetical protein CSKR_109734, partial [Clonorchis sinensis]